MKGNWEINPKMKKIFFGKIVPFGVRWYLNLVPYCLNVILFKRKSFILLDHDRARKHGLEDLIQADPNTFNHHVLFEKLQNLTLSHRLNDSYSCLVWTFL